MPAQTDLCTDKSWRHILQLERGERWQLLIDAFENMIVQVPGLVQLCLLSAAPVLLAPLVGLCQLPPIRLLQSTAEIIEIKINLVFTPLGCVIRGPAAKRQEAFGMELPACANLLFYLGSIIILDSCMR